MTSVLAYVAGSVVGEVQEEINAVSLENDRLADRADALELQDGKLATICLQLLAANAHLSNENAEIEQLKRQVRDLESSQKADKETIADLTERLSKSTTSQSPTMSSPTAEEAPDMKPILEVFNDIQRYAVTPSSKDAVEAFYKLCDAYTDERVVGFKIYWEMQDELTPAIKDTITAAIGKKISVVVPHKDYAKLKGGRAGRRTSEVKRKQQVAGMKRIINRNFDRGHQTERRDGYIANLDEADAWLTRSIAIADTALANKPEKVDGGVKFQDVPVFDN